MKASGNKNELVQWRLKFIGAVQQGEATFAATCRRFQLSRQTGYKFWRRYQAEGVEGLRWRSRAPHQHGRICRSFWRQQVCQLRRRHPAWGAKKIHAALPVRGRPAISTVGRWLQQLGLSARRRPRPRRGPAQPLPALTEARYSNHVWTVDFKGSFCTAEGTRLHPLTVRDLFSRYVLCVRAWPHQREEPVRRLFAKLFHSYGQPRVIRCDHGVPWSSSGPLGLSRLSVWWWRLGIRVEFTAKGHPEQNAAHEQHHRVLKADTLRPTAPNPSAQQQRFQRWRYYYNHERPHEALNQKPPASRYQPPRPVRPPPAVASRYGRAAGVRRVHPNGEIMWESRRRFISDALAGETVGLFEQTKDIWSVRFLNLELGQLHRLDPGAMRPAFHYHPKKVSAN